MDRTVWDVVNASPQPLATALALPRPGGEYDKAFLLEVLRRHGATLRLETQQQLKRLARTLLSADKSNAAAVAGELLTAGNACGAWLAACVLEAAAQYEASAAILEKVPQLDAGEERATWLLAHARNLVRCGNTASAWNSLRQAISAAETVATVTAADQLLAEARKKAAPPARARRRIALLGTGSLNFWAPAMRAMTFAAGLDIQLYTGSFNQYQQEILEPNSPLVAFQPEVVILAVDWRALALPEEAVSPGETVESHVKTFQSLWKQCADRWSALVVQHNFEVPEVDAFGRLSAALPGGRARVLQHLNLALWDAAAASNTLIFDLEQTAAVYGKQRWSDPTLWALAKQYPRPEAVVALARGEAALLRAACGLSAKCVAVDLDGTLWGGVIGEDGLEGIRLGGGPEGEAFVEFQKYLRGLKARGIALAICSKNNLEDALLPFQKHPEMVLKEDDFAVFLANWESKPANLRNIAATLNIGVDSLLLLDDNPVERERVRAELPEVEVPELPSDPALYAAFIHRTGAVEAISFTDDDRQRAESYRANAQRQEALTATGNLDDFLAGLGMRIELRPFDELNLPRIVQLINKTNQFNLTTRRMTAAAVQQLLADPSAYTQFMRLYDRFGDNGITGILIARREDDAYRIDNWLMSCRVLGRRVEEIMIAALVRFAAAQGAAHIIGEYLPTAKNGQVAGLYPKLGFAEGGLSAEDGKLFRLETAKANSAFPSWAEVSDGTNPRSPEVLVEATA